MTAEYGTEEQRERYTPTVAEMRKSATEFDFRHTPETFDRWLARERADAVRFEAERVNDRPAGTDARTWLEARAARIRREAGESS